jgi:thioredoxin 1
LAESRSRVYVLTMASYLPVERAPSRSEVDAMSGSVLLEFGTAWCGHCQALAPHVARLLSGHPEVTHLRVEDGSGRALGRSYRVRLWPNLVFLRDGKVVRQLARPSPEELAAGFEALAGTARAT